jgi:hypothetical protein
MERRGKSMISAFFKHWGINLGAAVLINLFALITFLSNNNAVYTFSKLIYALWLLPFTYLLISFLSDRVFFSWLAGSTRSEKFQLGGVAVLALLALIWLRGLPFPDMPQYHHLVLAASGQKQDAAKDSLVEVHQLRYLNGVPVDINLLTKTSDWQVEGNVIYSKGGATSRLALEGWFPGGLSLQLRYFDQGGRVRIQWDGSEKELDLYNRTSTVSSLVYQGGLDHMSLSNVLLTLALCLAYLLGGFILLAAGLRLLQRLTQTRFSRVLYALGFIAIVLVSIGLKYITLQGDEGRIFRDSASYVLTAEQSFASLSFWAGVRSFSVPLFLKLMGTTLENMQNPDQLARIAAAQAVFSLLCWGVLAFSMASCTRQRWQRLVLFGLVMALSLSPEIGLWDSLLLSESLTFSLFALVLAGWILILKWMPETSSIWVRWGLILFSTIACTLYAFVRDSNIYFVLLGVLTLFAAWLTQTHLRHLRWETWVYAAMVLGLFIVQTASIGSGNRWQIFMYDNLAVRFLKDPEARSFFIAQGLPMSDKLDQTQNMPGYQYQKMISEDPDLKPLRDWVTASSKNAYIQYLLTRPVQSLFEPISNTPKLLLGSNLEYRNPRYGVQPLSEKLLELDLLFFNSQIGWLILPGLGAAFCLFYAFRQRAHPLWTVLGILVLSLYPLMFLVWHAEPLEIERHAAQIEVQFRLAGWVGLSLVICQWAEKLGKRLIQKTG